MRFDDDLSLGNGAGNRRNSSRKGGTGGNLSLDTGVLPGKKKPNIALFLVSVIAGLIGGFVGRIVYRMLVERLWRPLVIGIVMLVFFAILALAVILFSTVRGVYTQRNGGMNMLVPVLLFGAGIFASAVLFEFIYELGGKLDLSDPTSYIFVLDDSGSMETSDGTFERYAAISKILEDKGEDFPYAVYSFSNNLICLREMSPKGTAVETYSMPDGQLGGTEIKKTLENIAAAFEDGSIQDGEAPKVLLLSDGCATDIGWFTDVRSVLDRYVNQGVSISTVGLGNRVDERLMNKIAKGTGGVYVNVADTDQLEEAMATAITSYSTRDLLSLRNVPKWNLLYCIERVLFMGLLGAAAGIAMIGAAGIPSRDTGLTLVSSIVKAFAASIALELLINTVYMPESIVDILYFVLVAAVISVVRVVERKGRGGGTSNRNEPGGRIKPDPAKDFREEVKKNGTGVAKGFDRI